MLLSVLECVSLEPSTVLDILKHLCELFGKTFVLDIGFFIVQTELRSLDSNNPSASWESAGPNMHAIVPVRLKVITSKREMKSF